MNEDARLWAIVVVLLAGAGGAFFWWRTKGGPPAPVAATASDAAPALPPSAPDVRAAPEIQHPIGPASESAGETPAPGLLAEADAYVEGALIDLVGRKPVLAFFNVDGFISRFVATVDNLDTSLASPSVWPVKPASGQFATRASGDAIVIDQRNAERYTPLLRLLEAIDTRKAVRLYVRLYPLFQQAYQELGHPDRYFNDRLVAVIDHLIAAPVAAAPIRLRRLESPGEARPSSFYAFEDPALEGSSAGRKILLRAGPADAERIKDKLREVRGLIVDRGLSGAPR